MAYEVLWAFVERVRGAGPPDRSMFDRARSEAEAMSAADLRALDAQWDAAWWAIHTPRNHEGADRALGACGDDAFMDVCAWVIAHGREVYEAFAQDPQTLADLAQPDPRWESGELTMVFRRVAVARGVKEDPWGMYGEVASNPVEGVGQWDFAVPRRVDLPWPTERKTAYHAEVPVFLDTLGEALRERGRLDTPVGRFLADEARTAVRFEADATLIEVIPYAAPRGDHVMERLLARVLEIVDAEPECGVRIRGLGWFALNYKGLTESGEDWRVQFVPSPRLLRRIGASGSDTRPSESILEEAAEPGARAVLERTLAAGKGQAGSAPVPEPEPRRPWWKRILGG